MGSRRREPEGITSVVARCVAGDDANEYRPVAWNKTPPGGFARCQVVSFKSQMSGTDREDERLWEKRPGYSNSSHQRPKPASISAPSIIPSRTHPLSTSYNIAPPFEPYPRCPTLVTMANFVQAKAFLYLNSYTPPGRYCRTPYLMESESEFRTVTTQNHSN